MGKFSSLWILVVMSMLKMSCAGYSRGAVEYLYQNTNTASLDGYMNFKQNQQYPPLSDHLENIIVTTPDYLNPSNQISFAAPVGAQHPNQKPQPEPQPPPYKYYHDHTLYVIDGISSSFVHSQRTFN